MHARIGRWRSSNKAAVAPGEIPAKVALSKVRKTGQAAGWLARSSMPPAFLSMDISDLLNLVLSVI